LDDGVSIGLLLQYCGCEERLRNDLFMAAVRSRSGHYIFAQWVSIFLSVFFSWSNLSGYRLDVYHTSTHVVALVRI